MKKSNKLATLKLKLQPKKGISYKKKTCTTFSVVIILTFCTKSKADDLMHVLPIYTKNLYIFANLVFYHMFTSFQNA